MSSPAPTIMIPTYHSSSHRDPGGVNPSGVELTSGEDPTGSRPGQSSPAHAMVSSVPPPPTPTRKNTSASTPVMALLAGIAADPPPPPANPPPKKKKRSSSRKKSLSKELPVVVLPAATRSVDDTVSATTATTSSPSLKAGTAGAGTSLVEQRRQAALAIYESERLVLDPPEDGTIADNRLAVARGRSAAKDQETDLPSRKTVPPSPMNMSAVTEPHSNQNSDPLVQPQVVAANASANAPTPNAAKQHRPKTPERIRRALTPERRRGKTPEHRRVKSEDKRQNMQDSPDSKSNKRGFFRKMFGKKKDKNSDGSSDGTTVISEALSNKSRGRKSLSQAKSSSKSAEYSTGSIVDQETTSLNNVDRDRPEVFFAHDEISLLTSPTFESKSRASKDSLQQVDSDKTSDPMGRYWNNFNGSEETDSKEQGVSPSIDPFTEPFFREPDGASPMAKALSPTKTDLRINVEPQVSDPLGDSPLNALPSKTHQVATGRSIQDPSPRGFQVNPLADDQHLDPAGESPLHKNQRGPTALRDGSPYAGDPPLYKDAAFASDDSSEEEEKKEEGGPDGAVYDAAPPPPPPPPPPRVRIPLSPRVPRSNKAQTASPSADSVASKDTIDMSPYHKSSETPASTKSPSPKESPSSLEMLEEQIVSGVVPKNENVSEGERDVNASSSTQSKHLTISSAARMNAKAVAYLHDLNGEPSPRHAWQQADLTDDEASPAHAMGQVAAFHQSPASTPAADFADTVEDTDAATKLFSAYSGKFKGRKLKSDQVSSPKSISSPTSLSGSVDLGRSPRGSSVPTNREFEGTLNRDVRIKNDSVVMGLSLLRKQRDEDVASGKASRVILVKTTKVPVVQSYFGALDDAESKDPIQRAGRRLLSKAAIPIQASARRFLAQRKAVDRMWALIEIQSYFRRFEAEASLMAYRHSATTIQAVFRGSRCRGVLHYQADAATQVQRIVRGYLAAAKTYDIVYGIILTQAMARRRLVRNELAVQSSSARVIQLNYRDFMVRSVKTRRFLSVAKMQAAWRGYSANMRYRFTVVDIVLIQNIARRWMATRYLAAMRQDRTDNAATTIQAMWRGFQGYTDYIFALVDVLLVQRTARQWLAKQKAKRARLDVAAISIQTNWRRYRAQMHMLYDLVHIIMVQSAVRRKLARPRIQERESEVYATSIAATRIQSVWRGFWMFSHFVIMQYEIQRLQAVVRGNLVRQDFRMRLGCCIMIQSVARRYIAVNRMKVLRKSGVLVNAAAKSMRETRACEQIQFWWRVVLDCRAEKQAALVIERFFLSVKAEVDREIRRVEKKKNNKHEHRRRKKKEADEKLLERVWLNTVDENHVDVFVYSPSESMASKSPTNSRAARYSKTDASSPARSASSKRSTEKGSWSHRASSPTMNLVMRHEYDVPTGSLAFSSSEGASEVSGLTFQHAPASRSKLSHPKLSEDLSLEEAYLDSEVRHEKDKKRANEKYLKMYGIKTAPNRSSRTSHFFNEGAATPSASAAGKKGRKSLSSLPISSRSTSGTPRTPVEPPGHSGEGRKLSAKSPRRSKVRVPVYPAVSKESSGNAREYVGEEFGLI